MRIILYIIALAALFPVSGISQEHAHAHARNEIGISPGVTYSPSHEEWGFGVHAHYFRTLGEHSPWALGGSLEYVASHGSHWTISAGPKYTLFHKLNLAIMPGVTFLNHEAGHEEPEAHDHAHAHPNKAQFSLHLELAYDLIHTERFHFGPAIDYAWTRHDNHLMLGIHCAYGF